MQFRNRFIIQLSLVVLSLAISHSAAFAQQASPWPQHLDSPDGLITVYQPQPTKFEGNVLTARAAVSLTPTGAPDPQFGAMWFTANVSTDRDARVVTIQNVVIKQVKLPDATPDQDKQFGQVLEQRVPSMQLILSLDQLESTLGIVQKEKEESQQLDNTPPKIVFVTTPTTLVTLDGPPKLQATQTPGVMAVVNTPFIMLLDMSSKRYFLKAGDAWMVASDVTAPWAPALANVPPGIIDAGSKLQSQSSIPRPSIPQATAQPANPGQILVAEDPTEIISCQGQPTYAPIPGNDLLYMSNTSSDVFMEIASQNYFVLLSGRWFTTKSLESGPWAFVASDKLPPAFAQIPADSPKADVLASIAGTQPAKDARMDAYIPQTTAIRRDSASGFNVSYDGDPQFVPVQNLPITYASNAEEPVLNVNNTFYCCAQAVWYRSLSPTGPWAVADSVPQVIYTIPPSCPVYNCRYVYVYDSTGDVVYTGYLPGYTGSYIYGSTVVYGTGYQYPFWYRNRFIAYPYTWGFGARYDYGAATWGYGANVQYGPSWFANRNDRVNWFGPQGYVDYHDVAARREQVALQTNSRNITTNRINLYNRQENIKRNMIVKGETPAHEPAKIELGHAAVPAAENNVFVSQDGSVYRRTATGWESHDAKGWSAYKPAENAQADHHDEQPKPQTPVHEPADHEAQPHIEQPHAEQQHVEQPHVEQPRVEQPHAEQPARVQQSPGGLEDDFNARQRGSDAPQNNGGGGGGAAKTGGAGGGGAPARR